MPEIPTSAERYRMTRALMVLFAVASGAAVGSLYYAQPLLDIIARDLHVGEGTAGLLVTATQLGYAAGILFIVPLGDRHNRRDLVPLMMILSAVALAGCAVAPNIIVLTIALVAVGVTTVAGQILVPFAGDLSDEATRGRVVGVVVSGLLTGILAARIVSGLVAGVAGWRVVFIAAAVLLVLLAALLYRQTPVVPAKTSVMYQALLRSIATIIRQEPLLRIVMVFGAIGFATFTMFWTALTFLLSGPPYHYSAVVIGLFGVAGLVGTLAAQTAGRLHDRGRSVSATGVSWLLAVAAWAAAGLGAHSLVWLLVGILALDVATQARNIMNQAQIFAISAESRSRINTAYVAGNFIGGAVGSIAATLLWAAGGWNAVVIAGVALSLVGFVLWLATRNGVLRQRRPNPRVWTAPSARESVPEKR
ncbi:MFS transporter [Saccharopolyspora sp. K220]|uniref:MFS transporter n=1 Tax=Saccharopolyspora soli TaxID=2926618 RepID=UPI001F58813D|nr:MFS transporter [Saccharopolyspora soli]MCI2423246.1 MFS transporter [Saccharopolyspora soli]